ncbi:hypothetical protein [Streptomyces sp. NPDC086010]|uniref:hypothetical protein n=1 Tax=Streptomyces sp. NPDC086010 TaxID=3365745 RepID=UPI0037D83D88
MTSAEPQSEGANVPTGDQHTPQEPAPERVQALSIPPDTGPTRDHAAVWLDDQGTVWADLPTVPAGDDVLPLVWTEDAPISREALQQRCRLTRIAVCRTQSLATFGIQPAEGAAPYASVWLAQGTGWEEVWADYPTADPHARQIRSLVWAPEEAESRSDLADTRGLVFTRIGWSN